MKWHLERMGHVSNARDQPNAVGRRHFIAVGHHHLQAGMAGRHQGLMEEG